MQLRQDEIDFANKGLSLSEEMDRLDVSLGAQWVIFERRRIGTITIENGAQGWLVDTVTRVIPLAEYVTEIEAK